jgi:acetyl esterase/lipase
MRQVIAGLFVFGIGIGVGSGSGGATARAEAGERDRKDVAYAKGEPTTRLDVHAPRDGDKHPIVVWIHGGGWRRGDKANLQRKPAAFNAKGYVLASVNYRLHPIADFKGQAGDVAKAVRWLREHASEFGGDPDRIVLMGHSAGAHLAALVGVDGRHLQAEGLKLADLSGVILLDGAGYDIPRQITQAPLPQLRTLYTTIFTEDVATQREASPVSHVAKGKGIPPFLILHVAQRRDSRLQSEGLARALVEAGVEARVVPAEGKTHMTINRDLGAPDDAPTAAVYQFLETRTAAPRAESSGRR